MKLRQIIQNLTYEGILFNTTVKEWIDPAREGDARNATEADMLLIGDQAAAGYVAQIAALQSSHAAKIAEIELQHKEHMTALEAAQTAKIAEITEQHAAALSAFSNQPTSADISKLTLMHRLNALGKWSAFKSLLTQLPEIVQDSWYLAQSISPSDPLFVEAAPIIKANLGLTDEQYAALIQA